MQMTSGELRLQFRLDGESGGGGGDLDKVTIGLHLELCERSNTRLGESVRVFVGNECRRGKN